MKRVVARALYATLFTGGLMLLGAGVANASETGGDDGILSGTQLGISIEAPITIGGNALSNIGDSSSSDASTEVSTDDDEAGDTAEPVEPVAVTSGDDGVASGSQAIVDVSAPVTIGGNAVSVIGDSSSEDAETVVMTGSGSGSEATTSGEDSLLGGTQVLSDVDVPVTIGGNAVSVIGDSSSAGALTGVVTDGSGSGSDAATSGDDSILGGTQILPDLSLPVTIGGNAVSVIGDSSTDGSTTIVTPVDPGDPTDPTDPTDPADPATPATPGGGGSGSAGPGSTTASAAVVPLAAATSGLASTGLDAGFWQRLAVFLLLTGAVLVGVMRFALRR